MFPTATSQYSGKTLEIIIRLELMYYKCNRLAVTSLQDDEAVLGTDLSEETEAGPRGSSAVR